MASLLPTFSKLPPGTRRRRPYHRPAVKLSLLHCLSTEGQRIFDALPAPTTQQSGATEAAKADDAVKVYDTTVEALAHHFTVNVRAERHRFRERHQLPGESIADLALALRELAACCNFDTVADENLAERFVAGVLCPRLREKLLLEGDSVTFDRAVEIWQLRDPSNPRGTSSRKASAAHLAATCGELARSRRSK
ncbi:hypothetical protein HPB48_018451 [Haemaphysalis longicornis]|uniref:Uncharacterized protein n=1 Tax=Haemaphysalis longicornis TaxID=44386 RepID=A0A9J6GBN2_HAELO|nr:hypothetical protein HPB48_018451 [Haemaphysalis longicornis]